MSTLIQVPGIAEVPETRVATMPATNSGRAGTAAQYFGEEEDTGPSEVGLPAMMDFADFIAIPHQTPPELVSGLLHQGSKLVVGGGSKSFKTWVLLDLALSVAYGLPFLGRATARGKVLYINFEIQDFSWHKRIQAVAKAKSISIEHGAIVGLNLRGKAAEFEILLPKITAAAKAGDFALIILDPIYKLYGGADENSTSDMALLMNGIEAVAVETGAAIAFGAHFAKGNASAKEPIDRISGSGVFARDPDSILLFTKHEESDAFTIDAILRDFPPIQAFTVRWQFPLMTPADDLDPAKLKQVAGRRKEHDPKKLLSAIADTTPQTPISVSAWAKAAGNVPRQTLTDYLPEMRKAGWIKTTGEGNASRQHITNEGKAFISEN